ncbi:hypothetical protein [Chitinophaga tropicalis]|uniref:Uncharacterized protein n=1 Tax=Chitinophaga tropicalis TaxID=2683588 RepID=A0A7K1U080_9BACT|nr:hypothetical protein [Chitinophaga tropicalis]MVT07768.1 hypothetical protein [Chitinophaga tropicalis]
MDTFELTPEEQALIQNPNWLYLKNSALQKVMVLMGQLQEALQTHPLTGTFPFPGQCLQLGGKISRGEKYKELPYIILDYPRYFKQEEIFAFRTMFWWGHYFIATLHLSGRVKEMYSEALADAWSELAEGRFQLYVQEDPWQHDLGNGNYRLISAIPANEFKQLVYRRSFIKLAKPYRLEDWEEIIPKIVTDYGLLLQLLIR